jgi:malate dehydrogenase (oxaloacetate-decarboxylating)(NADP+)
MKTPPPMPGQMAREAVPEEVPRLRQRARAGPDDIIPAPSDLRLIEIVPCAVAEAAMKTGVAQSRSKT